MQSEPSSNDISNHNKLSAREAISDSMEGHGSMNVVNLSEGQMTDILIDRFGIEAANDEMFWREQGPRIIDDTITKMLSAA